MFLGRLMRSAMVLISLKAFSMARSELLMVRRFWYFELPNSSKLAAPVPCSGRKWRLISHCEKSTEDVVTTGLHSRFFITVQKSEHILLAEQMSGCYSDFEQGCTAPGHNNLPPCLSWWWGRFRWAVGSGHLPLWMGLWGLSRWKMSSTLSPHQ